MLPVRHDNPRSLGRPAVSTRRAGVPVPSRARAPRARLSLLRLATLLAATAWLVACGDVPVTARAFPGSSPSLEKLGAEVLGALSRGDVAALEGFRLTEAEHNEQVWPELPASAPEVNFPEDLAWANIETRDRSALGRILPFYRDNETSYEATECRGDRERFRTFTVLTDCWVLFTVTAEPSRVLEAQLFKDVLVRGGGHKIFRYYDDPPRHHIRLEAD